MISKGHKSEDYIDISHIKEADIAAYYLGINNIPCLINSPLRQDKKPSFCLFSNDGKEVGYIDFSTKEHGSIISLMSQLWNCSIHQARIKIAKDLNDSTTETSIAKSSKINKVTIRKSSDFELQCKIRNWQSYDLEYWESYGISLNWLKYANVYPISHKIMVKDGCKYIYKADKYAYAYVEFKEGKTTLKIYQPFNTNGFKWANKHDRSVISLWTKVPQYGERICICASLKDALCLWANTNIPAIAIQGEGYGISTTAINELKRRYTYIYICLDNDKPGKLDAESLALKTGFINVVLPEFEGGKDISDYRKLYGKEKFIEFITPLFKKL